MARNQFACAALLTIAVLGVAPPCQGSPASSAQLLAQASPLSETRIREAAGRLAAYRKLLESPDANLRLAALSEMLTSADVAVRELAFKLGFASADSEMRSLALRQRLLNAKLIVLELERDEGLSQQQWEKSIAPYGGSKISIPSLSLDPVTGELKSGSTQIGRLSGETVDLRVFNGATGRLRLGPNATMVGRLSYNPEISHTVRLVVQ